MCLHFVRNTTAQVNLIISIQIKENIKSLIAILFFLFSKQITSRVPTAPSSLETTHLQAEVVYKFHCSPPDATAHTNSIIQLQLPQLCTPLSLSLRWHGIGFSGTIKNTSCSNAPFKVSFFFVCFSSGPHIPFSTESGVWVSCFA